MKKETPQIEDRIRKAEPVRTGDLDEAIERIYKKYGNNLQAFFQDANKDAMRGQPEQEASQEASQTKRVYCD